MKLSAILSNMQLAYEMFIFWLITNWRSALSAIFLILFAAAGAFGYQSYRNNCELRAHKAYMNVMHVVNAEVAKKDSKSSYVFEHEEQKNEAIISVGSSFLSAHASSGLAAAVHGFMSRALVGMHKTEDARLHMHQAEKACSSSDLRQMYALSAALMDLDSDQEDAKAQGLSTLKKIAHDTSSSACDAALYRLGEIYWNQKNYQEARLWWGQLLSYADRKTSATGAEIRSPWVSAAREKLSLIDYR